MEYTYNIFVLINTHIPDINVIQYALQMESEKC